MKKVILGFLFIGLFFSFHHTTYALFLSPYLDITVNENSVEGDGNFNFHIKGYNPDLSHSDDFSIQTNSGAGTYFIDYPSIGNQNEYYITQDSNPSWKSPEISCSSDNQEITFIPVDNGIKIIAYPYSSVTCNFVNKKSQSNNPTLKNLSQYQEFSTDSISAGGSFIGNSAVLKADVSDIDSASVNLEVEVKPVGIPFDGSNIKSTNTISQVPFSKTMQVTVSDLIPKDEQYLPNGNQKSFHWRARAVDAEGNASEWQEFSSPNSTAFKSKVVPLYTQVSSEYPSNILTARWFGEKYASGSGVYKNGCGLAIGNCGCALTSTVMILKYYGIDTDPLSLNTWLENNKGYGSKGDISWTKVSEYSGNKVKYSGKSGNYLNNYALLDEYLNKQQPAIAKEKAGRGGSSRNHFIVLDRKLADTYGVKDPAWFNTEKLNETSDKTNKVRGYENGFDGLRLFYPSNGIAESSISFVLGSPAELLVTDPQGRRLGKDPVSGIDYNEIPDGSYFTDTIDDPFAETIEGSHESKSIYITNPLAGSYIVKVIGTGSGDYSFNSLVYDNNGVSHDQSFTGLAQNGVQIVYNLNFTPDNADLIKVSQESKIYFDTEKKKLKIEGDSISFDKLKECGNEIKAIFKNTKLNFEWSVDKKTNQIKELEQEIDSDKFKIKAEYNSRKGKTEINIYSNKQKTKKEVLGLAIIKLVVKKDSLDFEISK